MLPIRLRDIALLNCTFKERFIDQDDTRPEGDQEQYPDEQLLKLAVMADSEDDEVVCFIEGKLDDDRLPFELAFEMAFLYSIDADGGVPAVEELRPTLVWLAFPHLRELIADLTGRSPSPQYFLPPLTRLPFPEENPPTTDQPPGSSEPG